MPESRDRLPRPDDVTAIFVHRRQLVRNIGIFVDDPQPIGFATPRTPRNVRGGGGGGHRYFGTPRNVRGGAGLQNTPASTRRGRSGRFAGSRVLPTWYPRTPLQDITAVVRAIERRRDRLRETDVGRENDRAQEAESIPNITVSSTTSTGVQLEHIDSESTPTRNQKIFHNIKETEECLTPLLKSIDSVEKVVMEEIRKFKRTPSAKKAEREKRVRTLMSMR